MHWFLDPIQKHYADFEGRVGRQEFWMYILTYFGAYIGVSIVAGSIGQEMLTLVFSLALLIPGLAITARRLHDIGKSGWWQLLFIIPLIGLIIMIILLATDTVQADNQYGSPARPKVVGGVTPVAAAPVAAAPVVEAVAHVESTDSTSVVETEARAVEGSDSSDRTS